MKVNDARGRQWPETGVPVLVAGWNIRSVRVNEYGSREWLERYREARRDIDDNMRCPQKGKGNKAWKRAKAMEKAWRKSGGFYVSDLIAL